MVDVTKRVSDETAMRVLSVKINDRQLDSYVIVRKVKRAYRVESVDDNAATSILADNANAATTIDRLKMILVGATLKEKASK